MNPHCPDFIAATAKLLPLYRQHPPLAQMCFAGLCDHLAWYWNHGTLCFVFSDYAEPRGVCLIKLFRSLNQFLTPYVHDPCGKFVMIELMVADEPLAMGQICDELIARWGPQEVVLFDRGVRTEGGSPRMYRWDQFLKLARRITYGVIENA